MPTRRRLADLVSELAAVRAATLALVRSLDEAALANRGMVNDWSAHGTRAGLHHGGPLRSTM